MAVISIPFPGTKRYSYKHIKRIFTDGGYEVFMEPFGGSGVLSVNLHKDKLAKKIFLNDYDRYFDRFPEALDKKDWVVKKMNERGIFRSSGSFSNSYRYTNAEETDKYPIKTHLLDEPERLYLQSLMIEVGEEWWRMLSFGSCFNHACTPAKKRIKVTDFKYFKSRTSTDRGREYMEYIEEIPRDSLDWEEFLDTHKDDISEKTLIVLDPPYFGTMDSMYSDGFTEAETLKILSKMKELGADFVFFNNDLEWMTKAIKSFGFEIAECSDTGNRNSSMNRQRKDGMVYVRQS